MGPRTAAGMGLGTDGPSGGVVFRRSGETQTDPEGIQMPGEAAAHPQGVTLEANSWHVRCGSVDVQPRKRAPDTDRRVQQYGLPEGGRSGERGRLLAQRGVDRPGSRYRAGGLVSELARTVSAGSQVRPEP